MERSASIGSQRYETFTEAVPLSLSSMAHMNIPLQDGVVDGMRQVISHVLLSCVNYARIVYPPHQWSFGDLTTSKFAWIPVEGESNPNDLPLPLQKLSFKQQYSRNAWIYLRSTLPQGLSADEELERNEHDGWTSQPGVLGRISLLYASQEPLTPAELEGIDTEEMPPCVMYKFVAEYRSVPPTGKQEAVLAEELSMLSFGGSLDDDVKYGALASLYDTCAKYVLEVYSVRGKKYKFDLMDSTLHDGMVPQLSSSRVGDPFAKSLCVTVANHDMTQPSDTELIDEEEPKETPSTDQEKDTANEKMDNSPSCGESRPTKRRKRTYTINRMHLTLEGKLRVPVQDLPRFDDMANAVMASFLQLNPSSPITVSATPSGHTLLLDASFAGSVFVNGRYVTHWGKDPRIGSSGVALFGMNLHSIPVWNGQIVDFDEMRAAYAQLWHEILVDAKLMHLNLAKRLMYRMLLGYDTESKNDDDSEGAYDDDVNTDFDCLESQVLAAPEFDRVGIAAKALATRFNTEFGKNAFPCLEHEFDWATSMLPGRQPVVVPSRLLRVLRRGGHMDIQKTHDEWFFATSRPPNKGEEESIVSKAIELLSNSGCEDIEAGQIMFASSSGVNNVVQQKSVCRYAKDQQVFVVQDRFLSEEIQKLLEDSAKESDLERRKAYLLGLHIAREHPDGEILAKYVIRNNV
ncbi:hypothetical protein FisN_21Hh262 [Fistulifera solaris]|uniref:Uncharacterized protein n=1 Tax=Fistulifera solaris TaxID=1519565 RepID=A0A1Z5KP88_FISSO|nr:hypothetical protein FisN_21Hh262 [Fistulifera solaris]|eukprot:GAX27912.1 hypothetical protein FisN_21Hh262 [Fistulifera solaris]